MKKRALISVFDKTGIVDFARELVALGWEIISTGGTLKELDDSNIPVTNISDVTGFPEILDGRVKTLTPQVHAGILARRSNKADMETIQSLNIKTIDMVVVNLYPFFEKSADDSLSFESKTEFIDIGGPTMLRSAAKNYKDVIVICQPEDYASVLDGLKNDSISSSMRQNLAGKVFNLTSAYDAAISSFMLEEDFPTYFSASYEKSYNLRYGENPHQSAAYYHSTNLKGALANFEQLGGKELSYNNIKDLDIAWKLTSEFSLPFCCALKHNTPCGAAVAENVYEAYIKTHRCDPMSIFGGIIAVNQTVEADLAKEMNKTFIEIIAAPSFTDEALEILKTKKNLRILKMNQKSSDKVNIAKVDGGILIQTRDDLLFKDPKTVTKVDYFEKYKEDAEFGMKVIKYVKSNAIIIVKDGATLGIGGGQVNRIWPTKDALSRAKSVTDNNPDIGSLSDAVLISDAFFPFEDCIEEANKYNIKMIVQPGGSNNDSSSIDACDKFGMSMVLTNIRHFLH